MQQKLLGDVGRSEGPDPIDQYVGVRLKQRRSILKITQEQMAKALEVSFQQIQKYENASSRIAASRLYQIAKLLKVTTDWFYEGVEENMMPTRHGFSDTKQAQLDAPSEIVSDPNIMYSREAINLAHSYYSIKDLQQRRKVLDLMKSMADGVEK